MRLFGLEFNYPGVNPDPETIAAMNQLQTPKDAVQLREFLGIAANMARFSPNLSQHTAILCELLKNDADFQCTPSHGTAIIEGLYRIWCGVNTLGDSSVNTLGDTSAFVNPAVQLLLTWRQRRGKIRMDGVGIVFEFYTAPL